MRVVFKSFRIGLTLACMLILSNLGKPFVVSCEVSKMILGGVFMQKGQVIVCAFK